MQPQGTERAGWSNFSYHHARKNFYKKSVNQHVKDLMNLCLPLLFHFSEANALSIINAFWWHFSGKQFLFKENKNVLR